jgi:hypothetical protein
MKLKTSRKYSGTQWVESTGLYGWQYTMVAIFTAAVKGLQKPVA